MKPRNETCISLVLSTATNNGNPFITSFVKDKSQLSGQLPQINRLRSFIQSPIKLKNDQD